MIRAHGRRLGALFLLTAFLVGGYGLSDLDAFLFHSGSHEVRTDVAHFDQPGGCGAHSERCVLALSTARAQAAGSDPVTLRLTPVVLIPPAASPIHRPAARHSLQF